MTSGFDIAIAARALAPVLQGLSKAAGTAIKDGLAKWKASDFPERLAERLSIADRVKTIWSRDHFVSLTDCYHPSSIDRHGNKKTINSLLELDVGNAVIEGIVGQGKSMFLHYLYLQELLGKGSGGLPLLILLRTITKKRGFEDHVKEALINLEISSSDPVFDYLAKSGKLILLLDGFDELDADLVADTISVIESLLFKHPNLRIIITSRPNSDIQKSRYFEVVQLSNLTHDEYDPFLKKLNIDSVRRDDIINAINESPADVAALISTPLMLTLVAHVYAAEKEIPSELPLFFERLFATTFVGHDKQKGNGFRRHHHSGLSDRKLQLLFEAFCFLTLHKEIGRTLSGEEFAEVFDGANKLVNEDSCSVENFKLDITKVACLMLDDGFDQTSFLHMSIAEYFAAAYIKRSNDKFATQFYSYAVNKNQSLRVVLSFLEKIDPYRFTKFYTIPPLEALFATLKSTANKGATREAWTDFMKTLYAHSRIGFIRNVENGGLEVKMIRSSVSLNKIFSKIGTSGIELVRPIIFQALKNTPISKAEFEYNQSLFQKEEGHNGTEYLTTIEGLHKILGEDIFYRAFQNLEHTLWVRLGQAKALIENEDNKVDYVLW